MKKIILVIALTTCMLGKGFGDTPDNTPFWFGITIPNVVFSCINIYQINQPNQHDGVIPVIGIITGSLGVLWGSVQYDSHDIIGASINIGLGSVAIITGIWNIAKKKPQDTRTSWNLYSFPAHDKSMGIDVSFSLRF